MAAIDKADLGIRELVQVIWKSRVLLVVVTAFFTIGSGVLGYVLKKSYTAGTLLAVATEDISSGGLDSLVSQLGPIASMTGLLAGGGRKSQSVAILQSGALTQRFIRDNNLLQILYADIWDAQSRTWKVSQPQQQPTVWLAAEEFKKIRKVSQDARTGLVTLTIKWKDPVLAAEWANELVAMTNRYVREKAIGESEKNLAYLNEQIVKTDLVQLRAGISKLIENEINKAMLARGREEYALQVIDPASVPERPSSPRLLVWILAGFVFGIVVSFFSIFLITAWRNG